MKSEQRKEIQELIAILTDEHLTEIEVEQTLVAANRELIERFEQKIQAAVARVWD